MGMEGRSELLSSVERKCAYWDNRFDLEKLRET